MTNTGDYLLSSGILPSYNYSQSNQSKGRRFLEMLQIQKRGQVEPGPGQYKPLTELIDRLKAKACVKIVKPQIFDEHLYEIVNGTTRVLQPAYMNKNFRQSFELTKKNFRRTFTQTTPKRQ
jgi:hypothetical protein